MNQHFKLNKPISTLAENLGLHFTTVSDIEKEDLYDRYNLANEKIYGWYSSLKLLQHEYSDVFEDSEQLEELYHQCLNDINLCFYVMRYILDRIEGKIDQTDILNGIVPVGAPIESRIFVFRSLFTPPTQDEINKKKTKLSGTQEILYLIKAHCMNKGWKRINHAIYENFVYKHPDSGRKVKTNFFRPVKRYSNSDGGIYQMIKDFVDPIDNIELNKKFTRDCGIANYIETDLCGPRRADIEDRCLPILKKDRYTFSYQNGYYEIVTNKNLSEVQSGDVRARSRFVFYENGTPIAPTANFINSEFDPDWLTDVDDWSSIPTPLFDKILEDQGFKEIEGGAVYVWTLIFLGRLLYYVGDLDNWQVMPFLLGRAGTGKSTILNIIAAMYENVDIKTIANKFESGFGLDGFKEVFLMIGRDIGANFQMDPEDWKSIISGEDVSVRRKGLQAQDQNLKGAMILAGNERPKWFRHDPEGAVDRRSVIIGWLRSIMNVDTTLESNIIKNELGSILVKINLAYQQAVWTVKKDSIHNHIPAYMSDQGDHLWSDPLFVYLFENDLFDVDYRIRFPENIVEHTHVQRPEEYDPELHGEFVQQTIQSPYYVSLNDLCKNFEIWAQNPGDGTSYELYDQDLIGLSETVKFKYLRNRVKKILEKLNISVVECSGQTLFKPLMFEGIEGIDQFREERRRRRTAWICGIKYKDPESQYIGGQPISPDFMSFASTRSTNTNTNVASTRMRTHSEMEKTNTVQEQIDTPQEKRRRIEQSVIIQLHAENP
jgi:hypothetical protein